MTAPLFLAGPEQLRGVAPGSSLTLDGEEGRHAATVRRIRVGERVLLADGAGLLAGCDVVGVGRDRLELTVASVDRSPAPAPRLVLAQALAKGGRDELAVETATEVGVDAVLPWQAGRCVVRWQGERGERARQRWASGVREAAKQARRPWVPQVEPAVDTAGLARRAAGALLLVLHEDAAEPLAGFAPERLRGAAEVLLAVGPEGGIGAEELAVLTAAGGVPVRLGPQVLRSGTAGPVALSVVSVLLGRWAG